jgi:hypothetical protein
MTRSGSGRPAGRWVKMIGASDLPLPNDPFVQIPSLRTQIRFPRDQFPRDMGRGDELLLYAVGGYKKIFATVMLEEEPERDVGGTDPWIFKRWPHAVRVQLGPHVDLVEHGPDLTDINPRLQGEIHQGVSHFPVSRDDYDKAVRLLIAARARTRKPTLP